jgi:hypothetical protein
MSSRSSRRFEDKLDESLQLAREALERLRAALGQGPLTSTDPSEAPTEPGLPGVSRVRPRV